MSSLPTSPQDSESLESLLKRIDGMIGSAPKVQGSSTAVAPDPVDSHSTERDTKSSQLDALSSLHSAGSESAAPITASLVGSSEPSKVASGLVNQGGSQGVQQQYANRIAHPKNNPSADCRFGNVTGNRDEPFVPRVPKSLEEAGLSETLVEELIMRFLLSRGEATGRMVAGQVRLPFLLIEPILTRLKNEQMTAYRGATSVNDYIHVLTDQGRFRARQYTQRTTYFGAAPITLEDYCESIQLQSVETQRPKREQLLNAFKDLLIDRKMLGKLGPAVNSGRGMFLYGFPGNGKTSIAERVTAAFGKYIWVPRAISIDGEIMRLFDPLSHEQAPIEKNQGYLNDAEVDERWIRIKRPTIIAGGELTMDMLEIQNDAEANINEAPLQLKSNCGVLVIDDFGRQKMRVDELLNRWIVPLEKRFDYLKMSSGKKIQVPFDQLVIFSTNLQPKDLVDDAFLRRIPYKIEVENPSEAAFRKLFEIMCPRVGLPYRPEVIDYLIEQHYRPTNRPFRNCHPRDLLLQVKNYCLYHDCELELKNEYMDFACDNYFSIM